MKKNRNFIANGILWSSCREYHKEILLELSKMSKIQQIVIYDLKDDYSTFIIECYKHDEDVMSDGYIDEKINRLLQDENARIVALSLIIKNPQYKYDKNDNLQCIQARKIKELLRKTFSGKIHNYFLDNIIHLSDSPKESKILEKVFTKYDRYASKGYLIKGCIPNYAKKIYKENGYSNLNER